MFGLILHVSGIVALRSSLPPSWVVTHHVINTADYGDALDSERSVITVADMMFQ